MLIIFFKWYFVAFLLNPFGVPALLIPRTTGLTVAIKLESLWDSYA
jgi:hypothetical protein